MASSELRRVQTQGCDWLREGVGLELARWAGGFGGGGVDYLLGRRAELKLCGCDCGCFS